MESDVAGGDPAVTPRPTSHTRDERGVALVFVLAAIALTSTVVVALLAFSLASARLTVAQERNARERRAADGALETGIGRLARSVANNPCTDVPADSAVSSDHERDAAGDPIEVTLRCRPLPLPTAAVPTTPSPEVLGGPGVEIVGTGYGGALTPPAGSAADATLVASGVDPVRFDADVRVARGAAVRSSGTGYSGAIALGQYEQGSSGVGAAGTARCGTLDPAGGDRSASFDDRDSLPACEVASAAALAPRRGSLFSASESVSDQTVASCPSGAPSDAVVEFLPGRYDAFDTARLNDLLDGSCSGRTFWFRSGTYLFDVNDASAAAGDRFALVVDDPTAKVVFGESTGWSASSGPSPSDFPRACDVGRSGASIQLTGRSSIRHRAGRVAICPHWTPGTDSALPAIVQAESSPSQPVRISPPPGDIVLPMISTMCFGWMWAYCGSGDRTRAITTTWAATGTAQLDSAMLLLETTENPPVHQARSLVNVRVSAPGFACDTGYVDLGRTHRQFTALDLMSPTNPGDCRTQLTGRNESIFEGASIRIELLVSDPGGNYGQLGSNCGLAPGCQVTFTVGRIELRTNMVGVAPRSATSAHWSDPTAAFALDGVAAQVPQHVQCIVADERCRHDRADMTRSITLGDFDTAGALLDADDPVEDLGLRVESTTSGRSWASNEVDSTWVRVDLTLPPDGATPAQTCSVTQNGFSRSVRAVHIDLFPEGGTCRALVERVGQLQGATATVSIRSRCMWWTNFLSGQFERMPTDLAGNCNQVRLPEFDRIRLDVTPASVQRPPSAEVTVDARPTTDGTSFTVLGDTLTPDLDIDVRWRGAITDLPVFGGTMSIRSLGSSQAAGATMGVVCCTPPAVTTLLLEAMIDSVVTAEAQLYVGRPGSGGAPPQVPELRRSVAVRDWSYCRDDCTEVLGTTAVAVPAPGP